MARLIFDLDGTLLDTAPTLCRAGNALLAHHGRAPVDVETYKRFVGRGMRMQVQQLLEATGGIPATGLDTALRTFLGLYKDDPVALTTPFPGVADTLALLSLSHTLGVATQKPEAAALHVLETFDLLRFFGAVTGGDTLDRLKPDPAMLTHTAAALGSGAVVFIGDSETDSQTARNADVPFVLHTQGYRQKSIAELDPAGHFAQYDALPTVLRHIIGVTA